MQMLHEGWWVVQLRAMFLDGSVSEADGRLGFYQQEETPHW